MPDTNEILNWYQTFTPDPAQRKSWYGDVAQTYNRVRPKYAPAFLDRVVEVAKIPSSGKILEVGCGPGTATLSLAEMGFSVIALEPSLAACEVARQNVAAYPNVKIINTSFEEWEPIDREFDAIVAATSWHWVLPENKYQKAASLLKSTGMLVLLWNTTMMPPLAIFESLAEIFRQYLPAFGEYKDRDREVWELNIFADAAIESGLFSNFRMGVESIEVNYAIDDYLQLLTTYSPCIALDPTSRHELLESLRAVLAQNCGPQMPLSYQSVFHVLVGVASPLENRRSPEL
ncbi:class I SAM-dependent methyltransferase [Chamaesiphon sp. VAR_69_metabat_338]|uniref:class I SAM-dependent methyltransferase n=1 Tax=Chamaesiphon sp. VAR_69_metabat_338 TaxID=2964704 RepID=UPI00286E1006|nr:class I SAM-dependent methyltransferase [Chamaesiphon sp. VAR_69_metabat_338]